MAEKYIEEVIKNNKVVVFSKSHCPFCTMAKNTLDEINCKYTVIELEKRSDCAEIQDVLAKLTGARTVSLINIILYDDIFHMKCFFSVYRACGRIRRHI